MDKTQKIICFGWPCSSSDVNKEWTCVISEQIFNLRNTKKSDKTLLALHFHEYKVSYQLIGRPTDCFSNGANGF